MRDVVTATALGILVGAVFAAGRLPIPAPPTWAGLAGVFGLFLGWSLMSDVISRWPG